jgi:hypothetical protein
MKTTIVIRKDKKENWFRVFLPNGDEITQLMTVKMVRDIFEEPDKTQRITATFEAVVEIGDDI